MVETAQPLIVDFPYAGEQPHTAGLRVESLTEWFDEEQDPKLVSGADGRARFPLGGEYLPTSYGLRARRP